jgi:hypothetical protein
MVRDDFSGKATSTLVRSSSGKELLLSLGKLFHALYRFLSRDYGAGRALDFDLF